MIVTLPIVFVLLCVITYTQKGSIIRSIVDSTVIFTSTSYVMIEVLSAFHVLNNRAVSVLWILTAFSMFLYLIMQRKSLHVASSVMMQKICKSKFVIKCIVVVFAIWYAYLIYIAYVTIPNNWDSMTYHLPRVMHWIQNQSVEFYATNIDRQITSPVLSEYLIAHTYLLSSTEHYVNLIQNLSFILISIVIYGIAKELGAGKYTAFIAPFIFLMVPMAIAQSFSTQTDLVAALYLVLSCYYIIDFMKVKNLEWNKDTILKCIKMATCIAFSYLAKQTVCITILFLLIALVIMRMLKKDALYVLVRFIILSVVVMCLLASPSFIRNFNTYGNLIAGEGSHSVFIGTSDPRLIFLNTYKNLACNYAIVYLPQFNQFLFQLAHIFAYKLEISVDDPTIASMGFCINTGSYHHDQAVSFGINYMILLVIVLLLLYWNRAYKDKSVLKVFTAIGIVSFIFICAVAAWSPWKIRYMVGIYAIYAAVIAATIAPLMKNMLGKLLLVIVIALSLLEGVKAYQYNASVAEYSIATEDPSDLYFMVRGEKDAYADICDYILAGEVDELGMILGLDTYEYPLWTGLAQDLPTMKHIQVTSEALAVYESPDYVPDMIVDINVNHYELGDEILYNGHTYVCEFVGDYIGYVLRLV